MNWGIRIRQIRLQQGISQKHLALRLGVAASYVSRIENGVTAPNSNTLDRFAAALGINIVDLVTPKQEVVVETMQERMNRAFSKLCPEWRDFVVNLTEDLSNR